MKVSQVATKLDCDPSNKQMSEKSLAFEPGIAGVDEAGRGPLAGPLVVSAVLIPSGFDVRGIQDSKKMSESQREFAFERILNGCEYSIVVVSPEEIDRFNILQATMNGMAEALRILKPAPKAALIDGNRIPLNAPVICTPIVKGDSLYAAIAAASILAKVTRDRLMVEYSLEYPGYGFELHKGYPTEGHLIALAENGACPIHRQSFSPVRGAILQPCLTLVE